MEPCRVCGGPMQVVQRVRPHNIRSGVHWPALLTVVECERCAWTWWVKP